LYIVANSKISRHRETGTAMHSRTSITDKNKRLQSTRGTFSPVDSGQSG